MKILFDENFPKSLKKYFWKIHVVLTVQEMGWAGKRNGELLSLMKFNKFDALVTADKNLHHQQNIKKFHLSVILIDVKHIRPDTLEPFMPSVLHLLNRPLS